MRPRLAIGLMLLGCVGCSNNLTRPQASAVLAKQPMFERLQTVDVFPAENVCVEVTAQPQLGQMLVDSMSSRHAFPRTLDGAAFRDIAPPPVQGLFDGGLITLTFARVDRLASCKGDPPNMSLDGFFLFWSHRVSDKALSAGIPAKGQSVTIAKAQFDGVTGLSQNAAGTTVAGFDWRFARTEIGMRLGLPADTEVQLRHGSAQFKKYDDGWRLEQLVESKRIPASYTSFVAANGTLADAELHFSGGPLNGIKLIDFAP
jgi:hypothetical protein